jgi:hypothetical protein
MKDDIEELQPIGMGFERIWKFFSKNVASGARLLLLTGLVIFLLLFLEKTGLFHLETVFPSNVTDS